MDAFEGSGKRNDRAQPRRADSTRIFEAARCPNDNDTPPSSRRSTVSAASSRVTTVSRLPGISLDRSTRRRNSTLWSVTRTTRRGTPVGHSSRVGRAPFSHLIYPIPEPGGLGVHLTLDLGGQARFGPDVEWIERPDYRVHPARADRFYAAIRNWWPGLADGHLQPAYAGVRPKIVGPGEADDDFRIDGQAAHGVPGLVHLYGIESPGLTAALAIGARVAAMC